MVRVAVYRGISKWKGIEMSGNDENDKNDKNDEMIWIKFVGDIVIKIPKPSIIDLWDSEYRIKASEYEFIDSSVTNYYAALALVRRLQAKHDEEVKLRKLREKMREAHLTGKRR